MNSGKNQSQQKHDGDENHKGVKIEPQSLTDGKVISNSNWKSA